MKVVLRKSWFPAVKFKIRNHGSNSPYKHQESPPKRSKLEDGEKMDINIKTGIQGNLLGALGGYVNQCVIGGCSMGIRESV